MCYNLAMAFLILETFNYVSYQMPKKASIINLLGGYMMRAYVFCQSLKEAILGHLSATIKLYPEEAKALELEGYEIRALGSNKYEISWAKAINDATSKGEAVSKYIYGITDDFPDGIEKPIEKLCVLSLRANHSNKL